MAAVTATDMDKVLGLNFHHLRYFWVVAREGGVARAAEKLHVALPTISGQLRELEQAFGEPLLRRDGRRLALTPAGQTVLRYADEIFALGRELTETLSGHQADRQLRVVVGVADEVPKLIAWRLVEPALKTGAVTLSLVEDDSEALIGRLAVHDLDLVLTDTPVDRRLNVRAYTHALGESDVAFFVGGALRTRGGAFPACLDGAPVLLPAPGTSLRRDLDAWFERKGLRPRLVAEFDDTALMKSFGHGGAGYFPGPAVLEDEICRQYESVVVGRTREVRERYYAISVERRLTNPAVVAISKAARHVLR